MARSSLALGPPRSLARLQRLAGHHRAGVGGQLALDREHGELSVHGLADRQRAEKDTYFSRVLDEARSQAQARGVENDVALVPGHAAEVITHYAKAHGHDLIVVGHRGHFLACPRTPTASRRWTPWGRGLILRRTTPSPEPVP